MTALRHLLALFVGASLFSALSASVLAAEESEPPKPASRTDRTIEGWTVRIDDRLLQPPEEEHGKRILKVLEAKLMDIAAVVQSDRLEKLRKFKIVLDLSHGKLNSMQYHPDADWLEEHGYARDLAGCVHIPVADHLLSPRQVREQPWVVLHELAHAYHDQVLGFDEVRIRDAATAFKKSGHGDAALLVTGERVRHYALVDNKEFFAEMTEAYFGMNDFFPFNRGELLTAEPEICKLMETIWGPVQTSRKKAKAAEVTAAKEVLGAAPSTVLWYAAPAQRWVEAVPVGNGRLGAMVFGGVESERVQLNEQTIWTGGPYDASRTGGPEALPEIRRLVFAGKHREAEALFSKSMLGNPVEQMKYQPLGNLELKFSGQGEASDYRRELDLDTATATVSYVAGGVKFRREVFTSPVDQVVVVRLTADKPGTISFRATLSGVKNLKTPGDETHAVKAIGSEGLWLGGKTGTMLGIEGRVRYEAEARILNEGGLKVASTKDAPAVTVEGADAVTIVIAAATNFKRYDDLSADPQARLKDYWKKVEGKAYPKLLADHLAEHQRLFRRVQLSLPYTAASARPTDQRIKDYDPRNDPQLAALMFQYGRYLLLCSSRPGCQPANLQGIWNEDMDPSWESKFTTNINTEMNYWPAEVAGLSECVRPLLEMVKELSETGARVAKKHYGARGWVFHQNTDQWRHAAPMDGATWGTFSVGGAWLCAQLWDSYRFTGDKEFCREMYPLLKGSAQFFLDTLVEYPGRGWLVTCPGNSPENFPAAPGNGPFHDDFINFDLPGTTICAGPTMDIGIVRDLFDAYIEASKVLDTDKELCAEVARARQRLAPMQVGKRGNLQEWIEDWGELEEKHRHISHLYGLYPSNQVTPTATPKLAEAAKVSLGQRGDHGTGFGMAWKAACWARLRDGDHANTCLANLVLIQTCPNLFSKCFRAAQVDGACGATAAVAEMLVQSYAGEIHLLPALPKLWGSGEVKGLRARGGFEVDIAWKDGKLTQATVRSLSGNPVRLRYADQTREVKIVKGESFSWDGR